MTAGLSGPAGRQAGPVAAPPAVAACCHCLPSWFPQPWHVCRQRRIADRRARVEERLRLQQQQRAKQQGKSLQLAGTSCRYCSLPEERPLPHCAFNWPFHDAQVITMPARVESPPPPLLPRASSKQQPAARQCKPC